MEVLIANVTTIKFEIELDLQEQNGILPLPFPGMDKSIAGVCEFFATADGCKKGVLCPFRHIRNNQTVVCKHWLRGLCKKGDLCEYLHEYDMTKMPECYFYSKFNACHNKECPFLHIDPETKIRDCPWYDRGFCRHGPNCRHRHVRRVLCKNYLAGFCPDGSLCKFMHPRFELPASQDPSTKDLSKKVTIVTCHFCNENGHKAVNCLKMPAEAREQLAKQEELKKMNNSNASSTSFRFSPDRSQSGNESSSMTTSASTPTAAMGNATIHANSNGNMNVSSGGLVGPHTFHPRPLEEVTCFKCGTKGHYANRCNKGHLAFLSHLSK